MSQPTLFSQTPPRSCNHCRKYPGSKPGNEWLWHGFRDADTGQYVCWSCHTAHYKMKAQTKHKNKYSETPVTL